MGDYNFLLLMVGFFSGLFGGLLGIGGSVILLPALAIIFASRFPPEYQHVYQASAMIMNFFVAFPAFWIHQRKKTILWPIVKWVVPFAILFTLAGVYVSNFPVFMGSGARYLKKLLGGFLLYVMFYNIYRLIGGSSFRDITPELARDIKPVRSVLFVGFPMGFLAGLLGIGGGSVCVPLQQIFLKIPLPRAIACSTTIIVFTSFFGAIYKNLTIPEDIGGLIASIKFALYVVPTAFIGGYLGSHLTYLLPRKIVRIVFSLLMLYGGLKLIFAG